MAEYQSLQELQADIQSIIDADTDDLLELAALAGLNPLTDFAGANLYNTNLKEIKFSEAQLSFANFSYSNLKGADFRRADLSKANFRGACLEKSNFAQANLNGANFSGASLKGACLAEADLSRANLNGANFWGANLREACLVETNCTGATFHQTNLSKSDLSRSNLSKANLIQANLIQANLAQTNLNGTYFWDTDLTKTHLSGAKTQNWKVNFTTKLPESQDDDYILLNVTVNNEEIKFTSNKYKYHKKNIFLKINRIVKRTMINIYNDRNNRELIMEVIGNIS